MWISLFAQVSVDRALVDTTPNCGNILAGVGPFAIERSLVPASNPVTRVRVRTLNTGTLGELVVSTPDCRVNYEGCEGIADVAGTAAGIPINFRDAEGSVCGSLFPTGRAVDVIQGVEATCMDNGMPVVILHASDFGFDGEESPANIEAATTALQRIEACAVRPLNAGHGRCQRCCPAQGLAHLPGEKRRRDPYPQSDPRRCHSSIGVFAAVSVATVCVATESWAHRIARLPEDNIKRLKIEHNSGEFEVRLEVGGDAAYPTVERAGLVRTARALFDGSRPSLSIRYSMNITCCRSTICRCWWA